MLQKHFRDKVVHITQIKDIGRYPVTGNTVFGSRKVTYEEEKNC